MLRKYFRKYLPSHDSIRNHRYLSRFGGWLHHPNLWHLNRDSVAGGVAIGLFSGLVPGPLQMLTAAVLAIALRRNLPVAVFVTLYTNPFTIGPLYFLAYEYGTILVGGNSGAAPPPPSLDWARFGQWLEATLAWTLSLGKPLAVGLVALALTLAAIGWLLAQAGWRIYVIAAWRQRAKRRRRSREGNKA